MQNGHAQCWGRKGKGLLCVRQRAATEGWSGRCGRSVLCPFSRRGFTIVELLVVIAIIGLLIAMLIPAVQAVRESARKMQCRNHLKQLAMAVLLHEQTHHHFPTGGWDWSWSGDPNRGFKHQQPGGWFYNILPYMEQQPLHDLGRGLKGDEKMTAHAQRIETLVTGGLCPSRRAEPIYPHHGPPQNGQVVNAGLYHVSSRIDYAINVGSVDQHRVSINSG
jgi:prepilin-type N-terminal cleavage/methylation domain-containing protein